MLTPLCLSSAVVKVHPCCSPIGRPNSCCRDILRCRMHLDYEGQKGKQKLSFAEHSDTSVTQVLLNDLNIGC